MSGGIERTEPGRDLRAAEYVLGTLDPEERAAFERECAADPAAARAVVDWERRLAPLALAVPPETPPGHVWPQIADAVTSPPLLRAANDDRVIRLAAQVRRWRLATAGAGLLAAGLALFVAVGLRPAVGPGGRYLAVVQSGGALPALVVRIDTASGTAQVRPVGAEAPAGRSLELWYVAGGSAPRTLGLVGTDATRVPLPPGTAADGVIAVSVEPVGGSPSGAPTGPVIYTGKLIPE